MDHGQGANHLGLAAASGSPDRRCVCVRSCLPGDGLAGSTCSPGFGPSDPVWSKPGPTRQKQTGLRRGRGAGQERQKADLLCSNAEEGQPKREER